MRAGRVLLALGAVGAVLALVACAQPTGAGTGMGAAQEGVCNAAPAQGAVGQMPSAALLESARVQAGARTARFIAHNQATTKEFNQQRLNLLLDASGRIERVSCG